MTTFLLLLAAILTGQLVSWFLFLAARSNSQFPDKGPRRVVMHYCTSIKLAAVVLPGMVIVLLLLLLDRPELVSDGAGRVLMWMMPLLALLAGAIAIEAWTRQILLDDEGIHSHSWFGSHELRWDEVTQVRYDRWLKMIIVEGGQRRLLINPSLSGLAVFELLLFERVEKSRFEAAIPAFVAIHRGAY